MIFKADPIRPFVEAAAIALLFVAGTMAEAKKPLGDIRGLEPANQPVVEHADFVFDAAANGAGGFDGAEKQRIRQWFDAIDLGYGDRVSVVGGSADAVGALIARYGLLLADEAPATAGEPSAGSVRIVVSRATASVPHCPNWDDKAEMDVRGGLSYNYGCATNSNLAAMIADPDDLVRGRTTRSALSGAVSSKAIQTYRNAAPTGAGGLK